MKVERYYLEIDSLKNLCEVSLPNKNLFIENVNPPNIELNKFFYKNVGKKLRWIDRLVWDNMKWSSYLENKNVQTYVLRSNKDLAGYFEIIKDETTYSAEIAYFGLLENFIGKRLGGYFLSEAIKICFNLNLQRVWVHTCTLDHKNALKNYLSRGMKVFKQEDININIS